MSHYYSFYNLLIYFILQRIKQHFENNIYNRMRGESEWLFQCSAIQSIGKE